MQVCSSAVFFGARKDVGRLLEHYCLGSEVYASPCFLFTDRWMVITLVSERSRNTSFLTPHSLAAGKRVSVQNIRPE